MDIGTAKPDDAERRRVAHHLIDRCDPDERYSVGQFVADAERAVADISSRGVVPVLSGGTGFYVLAYLTGLPRTPPADEHIRAELLARLEREGLDALRADLRRVDPATEERIAANDSYRVVRALEVWQTAGQPLSAFAVPANVRSDINANVYVLTRPRRQLHDRIAQRVDVMMARGLRQEYLQLREAGFGPDDPGLRTIGYREFADCPDCTDEEIAAQITVHTRRYAKRQETFFRRLPNAEWLTADDPAAIDTLRGAIAGAVLDTGW
jgi:tRNA dimethylallyltransferase